VAMSSVKLGPIWNRVVFDGDTRTVKRRMRTVCHFEQVKQLRLLEYIAPLEEEQLLNIHPEIQKAPRDAELWVDLKPEGSAKVGAAEQAGRLLVEAGDAAALVGVPLVSERRLIDSGGGAKPVSAPAQTGRALDSIGQVP
jgi:hypothetical protein